MQDFTDLHVDLPKIYNLCNVSETNSILKLLLFVEHLTVCCSRRCNFGKAIYMKKFLFDH